jgi:hypothetical protein
MPITKTFLMTSDPSTMLDPQGLPHQLMRGTRAVCLTRSTFPRLDNKLHISCSFLIKTTVFACKGQIGASKSEERCCRFITCEGRVNCGARFRLLRRIIARRARTDAVKAPLIPPPSRLKMRSSVVFHHACKLGCEGIVSKRLGLPYRFGRSNDWLKIKNPAAPAVKREAEEDWGGKRKGLHST